MTAKQIKRLAMEQTAKQEIIGTTVWVVKGTKVSSDVKRDATHCSDYVTCIFAVLLHKPTDDEMRAMVINDILMDQDDARRYLLEGLDKDNHTEFMKLPKHEQEKRVLNWSLINATDEFIEDWEDVVAVEMLVSK